MSNRHMSNWVGKGKYALEKGWAVVENWDCLKCKLCIEVCPEKSLKFKDVS